MIRLLGVVLAVLTLLSTSALADCVQTCSDTDGGDRPDRAGVVSSALQCQISGEVRTSQAQYPDTCGGGAMVEYRCERSGLFSLTGVRKRVYLCQICNPVRRGTCPTLGMMLEDSIISLPEPTPIPTPVPTPTPTPVTPTPSPSATPVIEPSPGVELSPVASPSASPTLL